MTSPRRARRIDQAHPIGLLRGDLRGRRARPLRGTRPARRRCGRCRRRRGASARSRPLSSTSTSVRSGRKPPMPNALICAHLVDAQPARRRPDRRASCRGSGRTAPSCPARARAGSSSRHGRRAPRRTARLRRARVQRSSSPLSSSSRIASAPSLPPGSRVVTTVDPALLQRRGQRPKLGRLADPLPAFEADEAPRAVTAAHASPNKLLEADPGAAEEAGLADRLAGDQRHHLRRRVAGGDDQVGDMLALGDRRLDRPLVADLDLHRLVADRQARRDGHGKVARRDQRDFAVAAQLDLRLRRPSRPP